MAEGQLNSTLANDNTFCQPCKGEGEIKEAHGYCQNCEEYMCQDCIKYVHRMSKNKGHDILTGEQMPSTPPERDDQGSAEEYLEMCVKHTNETLKFFCPDHKAFECGVCMVLDHKACSVHFVPEAAKGFSSTSEYKDQRNMLGAIQNDIQTCVDAVEERSVSANDVHLVALGDLKKFRKEINNYLDETERDIESSAEHLKARVDEKIEKLRNKYVEIKGRADKSEQKLDIALSDEVRLFMTSKRSGKDIEGLKLSVYNLKKTCKQDNMRYEFKPDAVVEKILNLKRNLGKMTMTKSNETKNDERDINEDELDLKENEIGPREDDHFAYEKTALDTASIEDILVISHDDVDEKTKYWCQLCNSHACLSIRHTKLPQIEHVQYSNCCITGMAVLSPGRLVVADSQCCSVKLVDTSNNKVLARYSTASDQLKGEAPFDVAVVFDEKVAVTYPTDKRLRILSTENNTLNELYSVRTVNKCTYVFYSNFQFYLSDGSGISIKNAKFDGGDIRTVIIKRSKYEKILLSTSEGNAIFYVPDETCWDTYTLRKISSNGTVLAKYTDWEFQKAGVVTSVGDGHIFLYNKDKKELLLMSENCEKIRSVMKFKEEDGIKDVMSMTFCSDTRTLFLSVDSTFTSIKAIRFT